MVSRALGVRGTGEENSLKVVPLCCAYTCLLTLVGYKVASVMV